jgi:dephospho-CoA kinase
VSRWANKYVIGLTGNIAVGKSVVRQMLQHLGAYTIDADGLVHQAMQPGAPPISSSLIPSDSSS